jgi:hypothetical protein
MAVQEALNNNSGGSLMDTNVRYGYKNTVDEICQLEWATLTSEEMVAAACAYYYFSIQFRENLETARALFSDDVKLIQLEQEECNTSNLSPWPGVALPAEKMNHDEFMRRTLLLHAIPSEMSERAERAGAAYLAEVRGYDPMTRALSISSYEDGGLEAVFRAILQFQNWDNNLLRAFQHFLVEHVRFDSDPDAGHGALSRHLAPDDRVLPLWIAFKELFVACVPRFQVEQYALAEHV